MFKKALFGLFSSPKKSLFRNEFCWNKINQSWICLLWGLPWRKTTQVVVCLCKKWNPKLTLFILLLTYNHFVYWKYSFLKSYAMSVKMKWKCFSDIIVLQICSYYYYFWSNIFPKSSPSVGEKIQRKTNVENVVVLLFYLIDNNHIPEYIQITIWQEGHRTG